MNFNLGVFLLKRELQEKWFTISDSIELLDTSCLLYFLSEVNIATEGQMEKFYHLYNENKCDNSLMAQNTEMEFQDNLSQLYQQNLIEKVDIEVRIWRITNKGLIFINRDMSITEEFRQINLKQLTVNNFLLDILTKYMETEQIVKVNSKNRMIAEKGECKYDMSVQILRGTTLLVVNILDEIEFLNIKNQYFIQYIRELVFDTQKTILLITGIPEQKNMLLKLKDSYNTLETYQVEDYLKILKLDESNFKSNELNFEWEQRMLIVGTSEFDLACFF